MRLVICPAQPEAIGPASGPAVATWAAQYIEQRIRAFGPTAERPFVLGLPTGGTPLPLYRQLVARCQAGALSFAHVVSFNLDEYVGLPPSHPQSYHRYMVEQFWQQVDILPENAHILDGNATDLAAECHRYEAQIKSCGGIELLLGGVGANGHIAFNEPGTPLRSRTRIATLTPSTRQANARFFDNTLSSVPRQALTLGLGTILEAREVMILAQGSHKARAVAAAMEAKVDPPEHPLWPVSGLQRHPRSLLVCDAAATLELRAQR
jgi:glucosamine-6-phosphate deaminase